MKETYFHEKTLAGEAAAMLTEIAPCKREHGLRLEPRAAVLLVLDMQDYFLKGESHAYVPGATAVLPRIVRLQELFLKKKLRVIQTRHINEPGNAGMLARWWRDLLTPDHGLSQITAALRDPRALVVNKTQYDAFHGTGLAETLSRLGVRQVIVTGVMTHLCCETTARSAFVRGFEVFFPADGTATYNRRFHLATLLNLCHGFAAPVLMDELIAWVEEEYDS